MKEEFKKLSTFLLPAALLLIMGIFLYFGNNMSLQKKLPADEIAQKAVDFINSNILSQGITASLVDITEEENVYKMRIEIQGTEYQSYVSKDGKYLFPDGYDLDFQIENQQSDQEISKRERPDVKLFVMSYCPFGLQAQKMYLPVYDLLGDKADMGIYFVDYIMHDKKEIDENLRQYCVQKEESEKYYDYLLCFVKDGDSDACLSEAGINEAKLEACVESTDKEFDVYANYQDKDAWLNGTYPKFDVHASLNESYGVAGSPTIVINDEIINISSRSPEAFKQAVCEAFISAPEECSQALSDTAFSSGFGLEAGASDDQGCAQ
jgi:protein-disulfide isomerase